MWEETLILLPDTVRFVFLSATIPNARQFADWIEAVHQQPCRVVYTDYRPTPLQHYLYPSGGAGIHLVVDEKGQFREDNFQKALATLTVSEDPAAGGNGGRKKKRVRPSGGGGESELAILLPGVAVRATSTPHVGDDALPKELAAGA